eukprot:symbB.v1.2.019955.t1/scaffold1656.1/size107472/2
MDLTVQDVTDVAWIAVLKPPVKRLQCGSLAELHSRCAHLRFPPCGLVLVDSNLPELKQGEGPTSGGVPAVGTPAVPVLLPTLRLASRKLLVMEAAGIAEAELRWGLPMPLLEDRKLLLEFWMDLAQMSELRATLAQLRPLRSFLKLQIRAMRWSSTDEQHCRPGTLINQELGGYVCLQRKAKTQVDLDVSVGLTFAAQLQCQESWEYLERVLGTCLLTTVEEEHRSTMGLEGCSVALDGLGGFATGQSLSLRIAGWAYTGLMEAESIFHAVCSVLRLANSGEKPPQCSDLWHWGSPTFYAQSIPFWPYGFLSLMVSFFLPIFSPLISKTLCKRRCRRAFWPEEHPGTS